jgi:molecular chaperone GrpE
MSADTNDAEAFDPSNSFGSATGQAPAAEATETEDEAADQMLADLDTLQRERADLLATTQRLQADFENYRKRILREQTDLVERASESIVEQLLPVLDSFELALANLGQDAESERLTKGIELVYAELRGVLERAGLEPIAALGAAFDPNEHEPHVGDVLRAGWKLKGRVLRPAMVKVVR